MRPDQPLRYPPHYPPTGRWQRFFIGVRWLGPDLTFFGPLSDQQKWRTPDLLDGWGGGIRQRVATEIGAILAEHLCWPGVIFLPNDEVGVVAGGARFDASTDPASTIEDIEATFRVTMPEAFWHSIGSATLGELVDRLLAAGAGSGPGA